MQVGLGDGLGSITRDVNKCTMASTSESENINHTFNVIVFPRIKLVYYLYGTIPQNKSKI